MAARWMQGKLAKMRLTNLRFVEAGSIKEAAHSDQRAVDLPIAPSHREAMDAAIASYQGKVKRVPCKGIMPQRAYGVMMKGKANLAGQLWTGGKGSSNLVAAPKMKGAIIGC